MYFKVLNAILYYVGLPPLYVLTTCTADIFGATRGGNIEEVRLLLSQRKASAFDVAPDGTIALMVRLNHYRF